MKKTLIVALSLMATITSCAAERASVVDVEHEVPTDVVVEEIELEEVPEPIPLTFRVTAYCACEKCCGKWALNRPLDENGEPIVYGASGEELVAGYSVASPLEFGTKIELDELGVVEVQDRTAQWVVDEFGIFIIDIYMTDHDEAWNFGEKYLEGFII